MLVFLAIIIAVWISIPVDYLQRLRLHRPLAVAVSVFGTVAVALNIGFWLVPSVVADLGELFDRLPEFADDLTQIYTNWRAGSGWLSAILPPLAFGTEGDIFTGASLRQLFGGSTGLGLPDLISGGNAVASMLANSDCLIRAPRPHQVAQLGGRLEVDQATLEGFTDSLERFALDHCVPGNVLGLESIFRHASEPRPQCDIGVSAQRATSIKQPRPTFEMRSAGLPPEVIAV